MEQYDLAKQVFKPDLGQARHTLARTGLGKVDLPARGRCEQAQQLFREGHPPATGLSRSALTGSAKDLREPGQSGRGAECCCARSVELFADLVVRQRQPLRNAQKRGGSRPPLLRPSARHSSWANTSSTRAPSGLPQLAKDLLGQRHSVPRRCSVLKNAGQEFDIRSFQLHCEIIDGKRVYSKIGDHTMR